VLTTCTLFFNRSVRTFLTLEEHPHESETSLSPQFSSDIFTITYKMNYFIYVISIATCKPNLCVHMYLLRAKQILLVHFIIIRTFRVAQKMLCTPWLRNPLTSSKLSCPAVTGLGDNFSFDTLKNDFAALIYK
jgi:hypothetical protein